MVKVSMPRQPSSVLLTCVSGDQDRMQPPLANGLVLCLAPVL